jgi:hypothetical protein
MNAPAACKMQENCENHNFYAKNAELGLRAG